MICLKASRYDAGKLNSRYTVRTTFQILVLLSMVAAQMAHAAKGRDFSAMYDLTNVATVDATHVSVKLVLRLQNHSGASLKKATVILRSSFSPTSSPQTVATGLNVADRGIVNFNGSVTVDRREYHRWQEGPGPKLFLQGTDSQGHASQRPIELVRHPGLRAAP